MAIFGPDLSAPQLTEIKTPTEFQGESLKDPTPLKTAFSPVCIGALSSETPKAPLFEQLGTMKLAGQAMTRFATDVAKGLDAETSLTSLPSFRDLCRKTEKLKNLLGPAGPGQPRDQDSFQQAVRAFTHGVQDLNAAVGASDLSQTQVEQLSNAGPLDVAVQVADFIPFARAEIKKATAAPKLGSPEFQLEMDRITGTQLVTGTTLAVHGGGDAEMKALLRLIEGAEHKFTAQCLHYESDDVGWQIADALCKKAQEFDPTTGKNKVVTVAVDNHYYSDLTKTNDERGESLMDAFRRAGVNVVRTNADFGLFGVFGHSPLQRDHSKLYVADDQIALNGGFNVTHHNKEWNDVLVEVKGEIVDRYVKEFNRDLAKKGTVLESGQKHATNLWFDDGTPPTGFMRMLRTHPGSGKTEAIQDAYLLAIRGSEKEIWLENAYLTDPSIMDALCDAAKRGLDVNVMVPGDSAHKWAAAAGELHYKKLLEAGVKIREYNGMTHMKAATFDGRFALYGSGNLMPTLTQNQDELCTFSQDEKAARDLTAYMKQSVARSQPITLENLAEHTSHRAIQVGSAMLDNFLAYGPIGNPAGLLRRAFSQLRAAF